MRKRYVAALLGAIGAGALVSYYLSDEHNRENLKNNAEIACDKIMGIFKQDYPSPLEEAGIPDQVKKADETQRENSNMVSEGSQYGVNYYNEVQDEAEDDDQ